MIRRMVFLVVALVGLSFAAQSAAQEVLFTYEFEAGSSHRYGVKLNQEMDFGGGAMGQIADFEVTVKCLSVTDGKAAMEMKFDKADMSRSMFGNMAADPLAEAIVGVAVLYTVDNTGEVTDIKQSGYSEAWDQLQPFVEPLVKNWYVPLPGKAHAPGAGWEQTKKDKGAGGMDVSTTATYKFKEMKKQGARECAAVNCTTESVLSGQSTNAMGTFSVDGDGKGKVEFLFDPAARLIVKLKANMSVDMQLNDSPAAVTYQLERELL